MNSADDLKRSLVKKNLNGLNTRVLIKNSSGRFEEVSDQEAAKRIVAQSATVNLEIPSQGNDKSKKFQIKTESIGLSSSKSFVSSAEEALYQRVTEAIDDVKIIKCRRKIQTNFRNPAEDALKLHTEYQEILERKLLLIKQVKQEVSDNLGKPRGRRRTNREIGGEKYSSANLQPWIAILTGVLQEYHKELTRVKQKISELSKSRKTVNAQNEEQKLTIVQSQYETVSASPELVEVSASVEQQPTDQEEQSEDKLTEKQSKARRKKKNKHKKRNKKKVNMQTTTCTEKPEYVAGMTGPLQENDGSKAQDPNVSYSANDVAEKFETDDSSEESESEDTSDHAKDRNHAPPVPPTSSVFTELPPNSTSSPVAPRPTVSSPFPVSTTSASPSTTDLPATGRGVPNPNDPQTPTFIASSEPSSSPSSTPTLPSRSVSTSISTKTSPSSTISESSSVPDFLSDPPKETGEIKKVDEADKTPGSNKQPILQPQQQVQSTQEPHIFRPAQRQLMQKHFLIPTIATSASQSSQRLQSEQKRIFLDQTGRNRHHHEHSQRTLLKPTHHSQPCWYSQPIQPTQPMYSLQQPRADISQPLRPPIPIVFSSTQGHTSAPSHSQSSPAPIPRKPKEIRAAINPNSASASPSLSFGITNIPKTQSTYHETQNIQSLRVQLEGAVKTLLHTIDYLEKTEGSFEKIKENYDKINELLSSYPTLLFHLSGTVQQQWISSEKIRAEYFSSLTRTTEAQTNTIQSQPMAYQQHTQSSVGEQYQAVANQYQSLQQSGGSYQSTNLANPVTTTSPTLYYYSTGTYGASRGSLAQGTTMQGSASTSSKNLQYVPVTYVQLPSHGVLNASQPAGYRRLGT